MPTRKIWRLAAHESSAARSLAFQLNISSAVAQLLVNRGVTDAVAAKAFLDPQIGHLCPPKTLPGVIAAAKILADACRAGKRVCVYGDYDVDGTTATAVLHGMLNLAGAKAEFYIPDRRTEGYGLNPEAVRDLAKSGVDIVVTVDCGATANEPVALANSLGLTMIVTDHHEFKAEVPRAAAVVHPMLPGSEYPNRYLCGVGVAFKLAWGLAQELTGRERVETRYGEYLYNALPLVALGTVADVMPLAGENRAIVAHGLARLERSPSPGLQALVDTAQLKNPVVKSEDVSFQLAPRLNAAGRLAHAKHVVELLTTRNRITAQTLAESLDELNTKRRSIERKVTEEAATMVEDAGHDADPGIVVAGVGWNHGVVGIVASKLAGRYGKPTLVIGLGDDGTSREVVSGSARSIDGFPLHLALAACDKYLESHGGHASAAGFRVRPENVPALREAFSAAVVAHFPGGVPVPEVVAESEIPLSAVTLGMLKDLDKLEPTGCGNAKPLFLAAGLTLEGDPRRVGKDSNTLLLNLRQGGTTVRAVGFQMGELHDELIAAGGKCSVMFTPNRNEFRGSSNAEMMLKDVRVGMDPGLGR